MVFENFGELIVQAILLFRFQWLVNKDDFSTLGFSFQVYVTSVMGLSFFTMLTALTKYHNRGRKSMRKMFSLQTACTLLLWIVMLGIKGSHHLKNNRFFRVFLEFGTPFSNKLTKLLRHASRVHFAKIHFG